MGSLILVVGATFVMSGGTAAEHFCAAINQLRGKVTMLFITHALPKNLQVDEIVQMGVPRPRRGGEQLTSTLGAVG